MSLTNAVLMLTGDTEAAGVKTYPTLIKNRADMLHYPNI